MAIGALHSNFEWFPTDVVPKENEEVCDPVPSHPKFPKVRYVADSGRIFVARVLEETNVGCRLFRPRHRRQVFFRPFGKILRAPEKQGPELIREISL